jgi:hypothetical protein
METTTTSAKRSWKGPANARRSSNPATRAAPQMQPSPRTGSPKYALIAGKCIAAATIVFGAVCVLIYTAAAPQKSTHVITEKRVARQKIVEPSADTARLGSALVAKVDVPVRDAPRRNARVLDTAA